MYRVLLEKLLEKKTVVNYWSHISFKQNKV